MIEQLYEAAILLAVGMLVVFTFLSLLIVGIHAIAAFVRAFPGPQQNPVVAPTTPTNSAPTSVEHNQPTKEIIAAITAAVHKHRQSQK